MLLSYSHSHRNDSDGHYTTGLKGFLLFGQILANKPGDRNEAGVADFLVPGTSGSLGMHAF